MIADLEVRKLQTIRRRNHDHSLPAIDMTAGEQLEQRGQCNASMRTVEHAGSVGAGCRVGQLLFSGLLDDPVMLFNVRIAWWTGLPI